MTQISLKNFAEAIYEAAESKSGPELTRVLKRSVEVLREKRLLGKSDALLGILQKIEDKKTGTLRAKVSTATPLDQEARDRVENEIKQKYKASRVVCEFIEKKELLGGMKVEALDEVLDTTYRNRLHKLEKFLIQAK